MKERDIKTLWGRSGNRCAICRINLSQSTSNAVYPLGEQAHIVAESEGGPRGRSILQVDDRNSYANMILLCPTDHKIIDNSVEEWPVEKLHLTKANHELWVNDTLSEGVDQRLLAEQTTVAHVIDSAVDLCELENWKHWTQGALRPSPFWPIDLPDRIFEFLQIAHSAIWPDRFDELKRATLTLAKTLHDAAQTFMLHTRLEGSVYAADPFYKSRGWNSNYDADLDSYKEWIYACGTKVAIAAKAANWFADIVRRDINPSFFVKCGKFTLIHSDDFSATSSIPEYTADEKLHLMK